MQCRSAPQPPTCLALPPARLVTPHTAAAVAAVAAAAAVAATAALMLQAGRREHSQCHQVLPGGWDVDGWQGTRLAHHQLLQLAG
jgi:hypothetical protein